MGSTHVWIQRGWDRGSGPPFKNHKNRGFLSNTRPDPPPPRKIAKLSSQHSILGHHRPASETPLNGVSLAADDDLLLVLFGSSFPKSKKTCQNWIPSGKLSGSAHVTQLLTRNAECNTMGKNVDFKRKKLNVDKSLDRPLTRQTHSADGAVGWSALCSVWLWFSLIIITYFS